MKRSFSRQSQRLLPITFSHDSHEGFCRRVQLLSIVGLLLLFPSPTRLEAQNLFQTGSGSWHDPSLWSTGVLPVAGEQVRIGGATLLNATISTGNAESDTAYISFGTGVKGSVTVENTRSWTISNALQVGHDGTLLVRGAGQVFSSTGVIGNSVGSFGTATVTGTGSALTTTAGVTVGQSGEGMLKIEAGGKVSSGTTSENTYIGLYKGSAGEVRVADAGSLFEVKGIFWVGQEGNGVLHVGNGGKVTTDFYSTYVGTALGSEGAVTITGSNSQWTASKGLNLGHGGKGTLNIEAGGKAVFTTLSSMGFLAGSRGEATVTGPNSHWENLAGLDVGRQGQATLNVTAGGKVTVEGANTYVGYYATSTAAIVVTGAGSLLQNSKELQLGYSGNGSLDVADGGKVTATSVTLGLASTSRGTVTLAGTAGNRGALETAFVGKWGAASKIHFDGGILRATGTQANFLQRFSAGDVLIHEGGAVIDTNGFNVTIATDLQDATDEEGGLTKDGTGRLTLSGNSSYSGPTTIEEGSLRVTGSIASAVTIRGGATLEGTGTVGVVTVESGGTIAPGNSAGTLHTGSQTWEGGGTYLWEVSSTTGTAGTHWDLLDVEGALTLDSTVEDPFIIAVKGSLVGLDAELEYRWTILTASEGFNETFDLNAFAIDLTLFTGAPEEMEFFLVAEENELLLKLSAIPEPGQVALLFTGLAVAFLSIRRKRNLPVSRN